MFLTLLKRAVKAALHDAVEEWAREAGLPRTVVEEMRSQRLALAARAEAAADAQAALALGVEDDVQGDAVEHPALPMPSAARATTAEPGDGCPAPGDDEALLRWVHSQRERQVAWADIAQSAAGAGHDVGEDALRMRYRRWREKNDPPDGGPPPAA